MPHQITVWWIAGIGHFVNFAAATYSTRLFLTHSFDALPFRHMDLDLADQIPSSLSVCVSVTSVTGLRSAQQKPTRGHKKEQGWRRLAADFLPASKPGPSGANQQFSPQQILLRGVDIEPSPETGIPPELHQDTPILDVSVKLLLGGGHLTLLPASDTEKQADAP